MEREREMVESKPIYFYLLNGFSIPRKVYKFINKACWVPLKHKPFRDITLFDLSLINISETNPNYKILSTLLSFENLKFNNMIKDKLDEANPHSWKGDEPYKQEIIHSWKEDGKYCALYTDNNLKTGSEVKLLKKIDITTKSFIANGTRYYIEDTRSIERWVFEQQLTIEAGFGMEFDELLSEAKKAYNLLNASKPMDCGVTLYNMCNGITKVFEREPTILKFCALFINTAEEDRRTIDSDMISRKIEDWKAEGLAIEGFFEFSLLRIRGLGEGYMKAIQSVSNLMEDTLNSEQEKTSLPD